ncbi:Detected protein of confused Function [Hibiscus syriacus]|uniref:Detected protein of confused Function n=1 Tax=Hibiscus syriacus TaxID=106335 RepID=A0A6A2WU52_HIBSY|nr:Detected protein of confused Function [Hibiscus syriacus]
MQSDQFSVCGTEQLEFKKDSLLDEVVDALYEKREELFGVLHEKALASIIEAFNSNLQRQFVEKKFATLLYQCLNSIKKGSSKEISLASHVIGLLALTVGPASVLECLAIITFVGGIGPEETEKSMQIMWQLVHPKLGSNVVTVKPSAVAITATVSAWSFLLTTMDGWRLSPKLWQESIEYLYTLLDKDDLSVRIAAGEALAVIFEMGSLEKFSAEVKGSNNGSITEGNKSKEGFLHIQGLRGNILNQVRDLSVEAGGKGSAKKDLNNQRNLFKDVLEFLEDGYCPETSMKIGRDSLQTSTWSQLIQLNFLRHFLGGGFTKHMQVVNLMMHLSSYVYIYYSDRVINL